MRTRPCNDIATFSPEPSARRGSRSRPTEPILRSTLAVLALTLWTCGPAETNVNRVGGLGEPCRPDRTCDFGLVCVASRCRSTYNYGDSPAGDSTSGDSSSGDPSAGDPPPGDPLPGGDPLPSDPLPGGDRLPGDPLPVGDPVPGDPSTPLGCTIEGVDFNAAEAACAIEFFETMTCQSCDDLFDSRICEDAINDQSTCYVPGTNGECTGCDDDDTRADGVTCAEIDGYSQFGATAAGILLAHVQENPCQ